MDYSIGYVVKRYPRYSETFIVNEILAHERAGLNINIFALRPPCDTHFQNIISQVKAPVTYIKKPTQGRNSPSLNSLSPSAASYFWAEIQETAKIIPDVWQKLKIAQGESTTVVYQGLWLAREAKMKHIHHFHAHFGSVATSVVRLASHFADIPYSFTAHAKDIFHDAVNFDDMSRKLGDAFKIVTVSDYNQKYLENIYGENARNIIRVYNGLNLSQLQYHSPKNRPPQIIAVGRLVEKKGLSILVDACNYLRNWGCDFYCQIVGTGELYQSLQNQIETLNLSSLVSLKGARPQNQVFELLTQSCVFAAPYIIGKDGNRDGLPTVLLEAMALGTPCVATDITGIPELIHHEKTGLLIAQNNAQELALALKRFLEDSSLRVTCAKKARNLIESDFDIDINSSTLRKIFFHQ